MINSPFPPQSDPETLRQVMIAEHLDLVRAKARRLLRRLPPTVVAEELVHDGIIGLIAAIDRFRDDRGVPFRHYAEIRIEGAMLDSLRREDWVPRSVRRRQIRLEQAESELTMRLRRPPESEELAGRLGLDAIELAELRNKAQRLHLVSLDTPLHDEDSTTVGDLLSDDSPTAEEDLDTVERLGLAMEALERLPERERAAVARYYLEGHTLKTIGDDLRVTEGRVTQLRQAGERRLRERLRPMVH